jgi:TonB-linked SusC/RagA family outer membrane protein
MKNAVLFISSFLLFFDVFAQDRQVKGRVTDETGAPLQGVSVIPKGLKNGTQTDKDGSFTITVSGTGNVTLNLSYVGHKPATVVTDGKSAVTVQLEKAVSTLDDVVVVGYTTVKRKDLLASVSSVGAKDLKDIPVNSAAEALNGRLTGVTATTAEGSPDAEVRIRVRGGMSITGDNSPLYVIDGVQMENALNTISPQDIYSIDVLKDAAATSIYGARGANGVIVITTKSGRVGKPKISYNGFVGIKVLANKLDVLDPYDFVFYQSERSRGSSTDSTNFTNNYGHTWDTLQVYKDIDEVDWQEETFGRTGVTSTHNISVAGGTKLFTYNFGYTYNHERAIVLNSDYKRNMLNFKGEYKVAKNAKVSGTFRYTTQDVLGAGVSDDKGSAYNKLRNAVRYRPFLSENQDIDDADPFADPNVGNGLNLTNPISLADAEYRRKTTNTYNSSISAAITFLRNFTIKSTVGYIQSNRRDLQYYDSISPYAIIQGGTKPIARLDTVYQETLTNSNVLSYSVKKFKGQHDLDIFIGQETYDLRTRNQSSLIGNYPKFTNYETAFKETGRGTYFTGFPKLTKSRYTSLSFFGSLRYSFMDKYLLSVNVRQDGASKFAPGKRWGTFPSASFAWRVKNEKFMEKAEFINDLKFRAGWGEIGNNRIADYLYLTTFRNDGTYYYGINNEAIIAYFSGGLVNQELVWESTENKNLGLDITLFNRRLDISVDYYHNKSKDLLLNVPVASTFGYSTQIQNIGRTSNKGLEIQLNSSVIRKVNGLNWNINFNISFNKNRVEALGLNQKQFFPAASWGVSGQPNDYIVKIGSPVGSMWGLETDGFYTTDDFDYDPVTSRYTLKTGVVSNAPVIGVVQPGAIKFRDQNGDGLVDINNDSKIIGNPTPKFTGGLAQQFSYRRWDASVFVNFSYGNDVYNANKIELTNSYSGNSNMLDIMADRWKVVTETGQTAQWVSGTNVFGIPKDQLAAMNANAKIWMPIRSAGAFYPHSWAIEDGSFLRINNITLGYSVPAKKMAGLKMSQLRFYFTANNLAVFTNYTGYDPEVSVRNNPLTAGLDYSAYPKSRSFIFGVNASF